MKTENKEINVTEVAEKLAEEVAMAEEVVNEFKAKFAWYEVDEPTLAYFVGLLHSVIDHIEEIRNMPVEILSSREQEEMAEMLHDRGYIEFAEDDPNLAAMREAIAD